MTYHSDADSNLPNTDQPWTLGSAGGVLSSPCLSTMWTWASFSASSASGSSSVKLIIAAS